MPNAISLPVIAFSCARERVVEQEADAERAEDVGSVEADVIGTVTTCSMPSGCGQKLQRLAPGQRVADRRAGADAVRRVRGPPTVASTRRPGSVTSSRFDFDLLLVVVRDRPAPSADRWCRPPP